MGEWGMDRAMYPFAAVGMCGGHAGTRDPTNITFKT
jgi:hypothetical protein